MLYVETLGGQRGYLSSEFLSESALSSYFVDIKQGNSAFVIPENLGVAIDTAKSWTSSNTSIAKVTKQTNPASSTAKRDTKLSNTLAISVLDGTNKTGKEYFRTDTGYTLTGAQVWDKNSGAYSMVLPDIPADIKKNKYLTSFYWRANNIKYDPNSQISLAVDKYENCDVDITGNVFIPPQPPPKYYKSIKNVQALPTDDNRALVSWGMVSKAEGYYIYSYNFKTKKYKRIKTYTSGSSDYYETKKLKKKTVFKFKIQPYKIVNGKKVGMKTSYAVSVVVGSKKIENVQWVTLKNKQKTIIKKAGKTTKLKAKIEGLVGLKLYSKKVRWFSSNKKIATVSKTGKVKFIKKGSCKVYAMAHNGQKSKSVKIKVK